MSGENAQRHNTLWHYTTLWLQAHAQLGNRWKQIASLLPGRTDNMVKNFWYRKLRHNHSQSGNTSGNTPDHSGVRPSRSDEALTSQHAEPLSSGGGPAVEAPATGGRRPRGSYGGRKSVDLPGDLHAVQRTGKGLESIRKRRSSLGAGTTEQIQREVLGTDSAESVRVSGAFPRPFQAAWTPLEHL